MKFLKLGLLSLWKLITSCSDIRLKWGLINNCNYCLSLSNHIWHATCMHIFQVDFWLLMVGSQIDILTPDPSFGHNLCHKYSNGLWKLALNMYISKKNQWFNELSNPMNFDPSNNSLKVWKSNSLRSAWVHSLTLSRIPRNVRVSLRLHFRPSPFHALALVVSPKLRSWHFQS